ncbi:hypothetical protein C2845_PM06G05380 [Panicum miliaceum]|uniref:Arabinogalactan peptide 16-like n=1 Tax=Panicum miliaceum TaxID=4540 RepID=A0A3L6REC7_PANMI|nr:hypothetical protein C2845_PM06G05380 [Panicum miliaceum]
MALLARPARACVAAVMSPATAAQGEAAVPRAPARRVPVDGRAVDQAVAYVLMAAALAVTYLAH